MGKHVPEGQNDINMRAEQYRIKIYRKWILYQGYHR